MTDTPLDRWLCYLETLHPNPMDLGLERVGRVARELNLAPATVPVVTVAGTNGKGSTVAVIEALLRQCGKRPGAFTSPHLVRFNERVRVDGADVADEPIIAAFEAIEAARGDTTLTYFEFGLLAALWVFREQRVDYIILEVGLGGRLDAANILDADVAVVTSIDLDHQQWLGDNRETIAKEKAGIMRWGRAAVIAEAAPPDSLLEYATHIGASPTCLIGRDFLLAADGAARQISLTDANGKQIVLKAVDHPELLPSNIAAAIQAVLLLGIAVNSAVVEGALSGLQLRGRRQRLTVAGHTFLLDVAHNPAAVVKLVEKLDTERCSGRRIALFSAMKDKAVAEMVQLCAGSIDYWLLPGQPDNPRALPAEAAKAVLEEAGISAVTVCSDLREATVQCLKLLEPGDMAVVFGSFFTVGGVLATLEEMPETAVSNE